MAFRLIYILIILANCIDREFGTPAYSKHVKNVSGEFAMFYDKHVKNIPGSVLPKILWDINQPEKSIKDHEKSFGKIKGASGSLIPVSKWNKIHIGGSYPYMPGGKIQGLQFPFMPGVGLRPLNTSKIRYIVIPGRIPNINWNLVKIVGAKFGIDVQKKISSHEWHFIQLDGVTKFGSLKITGSGPGIGKVHPLCVRQHDCQLIWWKIQLTVEYLIPGVQLNAVVAMNGFTVQIGYDERSLVLCGEFRPYQSHPQSVIVVCNEPLKGRFIEIMMNDAKYGHDVMKQTEIRVIAVRTDNNNNNDSSNNNDNNNAKVGYLLSLVDKYVTQMGIFSHHIADFATDCDLATCAISASNCHTTRCPPAWWQIDLKFRKSVTRLELHTCNSEFYVNTLQEITVGLSPSSDVDPNRFAKCNDFVGNRETRPWTWIIINCLRLTQGRYLTIIRHANARNSPGMLALSEIRIYALEPDTGPVKKRFKPVDPNYILSQVNSFIWMRVSLDGVITQQSSTFLNREALLAIDGLLQTSSMACSDCSGGRGGPAWWRMQLVRVYQITAVQLISSMDVIESNYLQEFVIDIAVHENSGFKTCSSYDNRTEIRQGSTISVLCDNAIEGKFVTITRAKKSIFMKERLAIAEIIIYSIRIQQDVPTAPPELLDNLRNIHEDFLLKIRSHIWIVIELTLIPVHQSGILGSKGPYFATDGNINTFAVAIISEYDIGQVAWWRIHFDYFVALAAVELISSPNYFDSNTLQDFVVTVTHVTLEYQCAEFRFVSDIPPLTTIPVACVVPILGNIVTIRRLPDSKFKKGMLVITEISFYADRASSQIPEQPPGHPNPGNDSSVNYYEYHERNTTFVAMMLVYAVDVTFHQDINPAAILGINAYVRKSQNTKVLCHKWDINQDGFIQSHAEYKIKFSCIPPQAGIGVNVIVAHKPGANAEILRLTIHSIDIKRVNDHALILNGLLPSQSGNNRDRPPKNAIDKNFDTDSAAKPDNGPHAWWMIDLIKTYKVTRVIIYASRLPYEAITLQSIEVLIITQSNVKKTCMTYYGEAPAPKQSLNFTCTYMEVEGRYVKIINTKINEYLIMAEVEIYVSNDVILPTPEQEIPTSNKQTHQISTFIYHISDFAVDGNLATCAIACNPCNDDSREGWWMISLNGDRKITGVHIYPCHAKYYANTLQQITVFVTENRNTQVGIVTRCADHNGENNIEPGSMLKLQCHQPTVGKYIIIKRQAKAIFRRGTIAIAEIRIYETTDYPVEIVPPLIPPVHGEYIIRKIYNGEWIELIYKGFKLSVPGTVSPNHGPEKAIDGVVITYTLIDTGDVNIEAWWKITFDQEYEIVAIKVIANNNPHEANYLQEFIVQVGVHGFTDATTCGSYINRTIQYPMSTIYVVCTTPIVGNSLEIHRSAKSKYMVSRLAMAEVTIYIKYSLAVPTMRPQNTTQEEQEIRDNVKQGTWIVMILIEHYVSQSGTISSQHLAWHAIDGSHSTYMIACNPCNDIHKKHPAWFQIQFNSLIIVAAVELIASPNSWETNTLQDFRISIGYQHVNYICAVHSTRLEIQPGAKISVLCKIPVEGDILKVERLPNSSFKKNYLIIAEIMIYSMKTTTTEEEFERDLEQGKFEGVPVEPSRQPWEIKFEVNYIFPCTGRCGVYFIEETEWIVLFNVEIEVVAVQIIFSEYYQPQYLTDLVVKVGKTKNGVIICSSYTKDLLIRNMVTMKCNQPLKGKIITIFTRMPVASPTPSIQIFEVKVYTITTNRTIEEEIKLPLNNLNAEQSTTPNPERPAGKAIDGDRNSMSETDTLDKPGERPVGWWKVDLKITYRISRVLITSSSDLYYAYYLQMFDVIVITEKRVEKICASYRDEPFEPLVTKELKCTEQGRYVMVRKLPESYKRESLMIAEIEIYVFRQLIDRIPEEVNIPLKNKKPIQVGVFIYHIPEFAIDGDHHTCAVACNPCDDRTGHGWWQIYLGRPRTISRVEIYACNTRYYAKMLTQITVGVSNDTTTDWDKFTKCGDYNVDDVYAGSMINIKCHRPTTGKHVTIIRQKIAIHRAESIAIAEVKIFEITENPQEELPPEDPPVDKRIFDEKVRVNEWVLLILRQSRITQVGIDNRTKPSNGIDGNPFTCIIAISDSNNEPAWWKMEMIAEHTIVGLIITSCSDFINSNLLQEFVVQVELLRAIRICTNYRNITDIPRGTKIYLICNTPLQGNTIIIIRSPNSRFNPGIISFAEIEVYIKVTIWYWTTSPDPGLPPGPPGKQGPPIWPPGQPGPSISPPGQTGPPIWPPGQTGPPIWPPGQTGPSISPPSQPGPSIWPPGQTGPPIWPPGQTGPSIWPPGQTGPPIWPPGQTGPSIWPPGQTGPPIWPPGQTGPSIWPPGQTGPPIWPPGPTGPPIWPPGQTGPSIWPPGQTGPSIWPPGQTGPSIWPPGQTGPPIWPPGQTGPPIWPPGSFDWPTCPPGKPCPSIPPPLILPWPTNRPPLPPAWPTIQPPLPPPWPTHGGQNLPSTRPQWPVWPTRPPHIIPPCLKPTRPPCPGCPPLPCPWWPTVPSLDDPAATIRNEIEKQNWIIIEIREQIIYHSGTKPNHDPSLAVDGDRSTFAVICNPCGEFVTYLKHAWMRIEFVTIFQITATELTCSPSYEPDTLRDFMILVGFGQPSDPICGEYMQRSGYLYPGTRLYVMCSNSMSGKVITIQRMPNSDYKKGLMVIAEIVIFAKKIELDVSIEIIIETRITQGIWIEVILEQIQILPGPITCQLCGHYLTIHKNVVISLVQRLSVTAVMIQYTASCDLEFVVGDAINKGRVCSRFEKSNDKKNLVRMYIMCDQPYKGRFVTIRRKSIERVAIEVVNVRVYVVNPTDSMSQQGEKLPRGNLMATQSGGSGGNFPPWNAIDGNIKTWSQTSPVKGEQVGWWKVDMGRDYQVLGVSITSPNDLYRAYDLQEFQIMSIGEHGEAGCYIYDGEPFSPEETKYFACQHPLKGRNLVIKKLITSFDRFRISLAEVEIYVTSLSAPIRKGVAEGNATAIGSYNFHVAQFAVDGDSRTCAIACFPCVGRPMRGYDFGWWQYDFGKSRTVYAVHILTCNTQQEANYLLDIIIGTSQTSVTNTKGLSICTQVRSKQNSLPINYWQTFKCQKLINGRYLLVKRNNHARYKPEIIALAEIKIEEKPGSFIDVTIRQIGLLITPEALKVNVAKKMWHEISLGHLVTSQTGTFSNYKAQFAVDNNPSTFSVGCNPCGVSKGKAGWWKINLGGRYMITAVEVLSSPEEYYSNMLQEFVVLVTDQRSMDTVCMEYSYPTYISPLTKISLLCQNPLDGHTVTLKRKLRSGFRADAMAIAEIYIYKSKSLRSSKWEQIPPKTKEKPRDRPSKPRKNFHTKNET